MDTKQEQRNREKQIAQAAITYSNKICKNRVREKYNLSARDLIELSFIAGAKVADKCPRRGLVKIEYVEAIHRMWLEDDNDNSDFLEYFVNYCEEKGWL